MKIKLKKQRRRGKRRLSVLLFMVDGLSHLMARRVMNTTYYYLLNEQQAIPLNGFHSLGSKAYSNIIPYLTG